MARIPGVRADSHAAWLWLLAIVLAGVATWLWGRSPATTPGVNSVGATTEGVSLGAVHEDDFVELETIEAQFGLDPIDESDDPGEPQTTE